jgi:signal transduction histidine kinase
MKYLFSIVFIFCITQVLGQKSATINALPDDGSLLVKHWKWHSGDNPLWATPAFDDQNWSKFVPTEKIQTFPQLLETQIGWFRRPIKVAPTLANRPLYLNIEQMGASEIYLDGKLVHQLGVVSVNPKQEVTHTYAKFLPIKSIFELRLVDMKESGEKLFTKSRQTTGVICLCIGIFLVFSILHFSFFASNRRQKVSLWLGFTMSFLAISFVSNLLENNRNTISYQQINELVTVIFFYAGVLCINISLYLYLSQPFRFFFYLQAAIMIGSLFCIVFGIDLPYFTEVWLSYLLIFVDFIRVSVLADKRKNPNAKVPIYSLLTVGACFTIVILFSLLMGLLVQNTQFWGDFAEVFIVFSVALFTIMCMSIPVGLSFSLVREYSGTHKALTKKIQEIETLSAKSLAQEQEKQQILATQNELLEQQVNERTAELHESIEHLKTTQAQLIQSEKLASLGELTAGIAHEIQNPLNFVNNFSEVSVDIANELKEERKKAESERDESLEDELLNDLIENQEKINYHGKRASSIVKGMLEHSRMNTGERELTDINQLTDEYLRLSYHGLRAKDKAFNADYELIANENIPKINVVPQEIGRVLLNLINNAFYTVNERSKSGETGYRPKVSILTKMDEDPSDRRAVEIRIQDNGKGMSESTKAKIFQPFFTTKPTGEGTGLGLSLAYDIITKGHGGTIEVESVQGKGTTFTVCIPCSFP